jgi:hypothetical protein
MSDSERGPTEGPLHVYSIIWFLGVFMGVDVFSGNSPRSSALQAASVIPTESGKAAMRIEVLNTRRCEVWFGLSGSRAPESSSSVRHLTQSEQHAQHQ